MDRPSATASILSYETRFWYARDPQAGEVVLHLEQRLHNISSHTVVFSIWELTPYLGSMAPKGSFETSVVPLKPPVQAPPTAEHVKRLLPGETTVLSNWYWPRAEFPLPSLGGKDGFAKQFKVKKDGKLRVVVCVEFGTSGEIFQTFLKPGESLLQGKLCAAPVELDYQILQRDE